MVGPAQEIPSALRQLALAVDADHATHLYLDRGDGVLELVASTGEGGIVPSEGLDTGEAGRGFLQRLWPSSRDSGGAPGANQPKHPLS